MPPSSPGAAETARGSGAKAKADEPAKPPQCPEGMVYIDPVETPEELVPFCLGALEVTVGEYRACVDAGHCRPVDVELYVDMEMTWLSGDPELPINYIAWSDAFAYCRFIGGRLPTEAEWLWVAGPGRGRPYPWGEVTPYEEEPAYCGQYREPGETEPAPVKPCHGGRHKYDRTEEGVYDIAASMWEFVAADETGAGGHYGMTIPFGADPDKEQLEYRTGGSPTMHGRSQDDQDGWSQLGLITVRCAAPAVR